MYFRLIFMYLATKLRRRISILDELETWHRVLPNDLDPLGHMNNGRYFAIADLARIEALLRSGLWKTMSARGQYPVLAGATIQFRIALEPFQLYRILTKVAGWDGKFIYVQHIFQREGAVHSLALVKIRVVGKDRPHPADVLRYNVTGIPDTKMDGVIEKWNISSDDHWVSIQPGS